MSLSSLIVQREIASIRAVEEALARQVLYGGDLATNLLEVTSIEEWRLAVLVAESFGYPVAPAGELPMPSERARALVPSELALRRSMLPLDADHQRIIVVLSEPLTREDEEQLAFALGLIVEQRIALYPRVRQALTRAYGAPLERRAERLLAKLAGAPPPSGPTSRPPLLAEPPVAPAPPRPPSDAPREPLDTAPESPAAKAPVPLPRATQRGFPAVDDVRIVEAPAIHTAVTTPPAVHTAVTTPPTVHDAVTAPPAAPLEPISNKPVRKATMPFGMDALTVEHSKDAPTLVPPALTFARPGGAEPRPLRRRRGPITFDAAKEELSRAAERDALLDLLFDFCRQFFDYSALFIVKDELAEGRDAFGEGLSRDAIVNIAVPLVEPSLLRAARESKRAVVRALDHNPTSVDAILATDLGRGRVDRALAIPIVVRGRVVALFYGDAGAGGIDESAAAEAIEVGALVGAAFERIIVRKKLAGFSSGAGDAVAKVDSARVPAKPRSDQPSMRTRAEAFKRAVFGDEPTREGVTPEVIEAPASKQTPFETPLARGAIPLVLKPEAASSPPPPSSPELKEQPTAWKRASSRPPPNAEPAFFTPPPPPPEVSLVRKPTGPPIPREEPREDELEEADVIVIEPPRMPMPSTPDIDSVVMDDETASALIREAELQERSAFALAHAPRPPPSSRKISTRLPSIIVDTDGDYAVLIDRLLAGDEDAEAELLRDGVVAMPAIMARFPGPLRVSRDRLKDPLPRVNDCGPILRVIAHMRRVALPFVLPNVATDDVELRTWATFLLTELAYPEAVEALVPRLFDTDPRVRLVARAAARRLSAVAQEALLGALGRVLRDPRATRHGKIGVLETLGDVREPLAVPLLIRYLEDEDEEIATVARRALIQITRQDFARETRKWLAWWGASSSRHRIEWLIDALTDDTPGMRRAAGEELKQLTDETFGFYEDLPKLERERAQQRYRDWWASEGRARFTR